jgi:hypothetical protein
MKYKFENKGLLATLSSMFFLTKQQRKKEDTKMYMVIKKELFKKAKEALEHVASNLRLYGEEKFIHDQAARDGFLVVDGRCSDPDCVVCEPETIIPEMDEALATMEVASAAHLQALFQMKVEMDEAILSHTIMKDEPSPLDIRYSDSLFPFEDVSAASLAG